MDLAELVLLKGPLLDPKLTLDAKGAAGMAVALGAAGATGGLSLWADRLLHAPPDPNPCRYAASGQAGATPAASGPAQTAGKALSDLMRKVFK